jgi:hypothetical protein
MSAVHLAPGQRVPGPGALRACCDQLGCPRAQSQTATARPRVVEDKKDGTGVLVTTSSFGKTTDEFAQHNERVRLIEGPHLKQRIQEHLGLDVLT